MERYDDMDYPWQGVIARNNTVETDINNKMPLAMAYIPIQRWEKTYEINLALDRGTIFPELDFPFTGEGTIREVRE